MDSDEAADAVPVDAGGGLKVLLVEDESSDLWLLSETLRGRGHAVVSCPTAEIAWEAYLRERPPLVLLDLVLPGQDGLSLARRIRASPGGEWPVILVVTIRKDVDILHEVLEAGADDYLAKPIDMPLLDIRLAVAERTVRRQQERRAIQEELARKTAEVRTLVDTLEQVLFAVDLERDRLVHLSPGAEKLLGRAADELEARPDRWRDVLLPGTLGSGPEWAQLMAGEGVTVQFPAPIEDEERWLEATLKTEPSPDGRASRLEGVIADVTERRRAREQIGARNRELATLYRISEITLSAPSIERAYEDVLEEICRTTGFPVAFIAHHDPGRDVLMVIGARGVGAPAGEELTVRVAGTLAGRTLQRAQPVVRNPGRADELGNEELRRLALRTWLSVPLVTSGEVVGILVLADTREWQPDEKLVRWTGSLASSIAAFVERLATQEALKESERRYRGLTEKLQQANQELESFAYSVSHDLRAPLRTMQGFAHTLLHEYGDLLEPGARDYVRRIIRSGQASEELISDLLDYSRISSEELEVQEVPLGEVVAAALDTASGDLAEREADVEVEGDLPVVLGHTRILTQVLTNLLSNAVKFVDPDRVPRVRIRAETRGDTVRVWVVDNGIGVPADRRERIFRVFERLPSAAVNRPGTGIGLAIVRRGMQRIGGRAGVEDAPGEEGGSAFWIDVPRRTAKGGWQPWGRNR